MRTRFSLCPFFFFPLGKDRDDRYRAKIHFNLQRAARQRSRLERVASRRVGWNRLTSHERWHRRGHTIGVKGFEEESIRIQLGRALTVQRGAKTNRFIDELSRIKAGPAGRARAILHAHVFPLNFQKLFYHRRILPPISRDIHRVRVL